ncbi:MchS3 family protein [Serratia sp. NA_112.1]|uniref:MchS3 family protein n=1 Tax=Serratia sp. NA_112.1 TaxID=3415665 RepID=UPI004046953D
MKMIFRVVTLFVVSFCSFYGYTAEQSSEETENVLSRVNNFSLGMNGFVGIGSVGETELIKILTYQDAGAIFLRIAKNPQATPEAKLYAACGLKKLNNNGEADFAQEWDKQVSVLKGDILRTEKFKEVYFTILKHGCW